MRDFLATLRGKLYSLRNRMLGRKIFVSGNLKIYKKLGIIGDGAVYIGRNCIVDGIHGDKSQYVTIDTHDKDAVISIGDNVCLYAARISAKYHIAIGNDVLIEEAGIVDTDFHSIDRGRGKPEGENRDKCRIAIGDRVCIGAKSIITKGVTIGDDVVVWPGSVVIRSIEKGAIVMGNPAKEVKLT
jgi:acetyltransferase-like isoleucine patch superfamily enzyme